jgi:hypothetical protein
MTDKSISHKETVEEVKKPISWYLNELSGIYNEEAVKTALIEIAEEVEN